MVRLDPPTRSYAHSSWGGDDVDLPLGRAVRQVESEGGVDLRFAFAVGVPECLGDVAEACGPVGGPRWRSQVAPTGVGHRYIYAAHRIY